jgi:hypothetical protein
MKLNITKQSFLLTQYNKTKLKKQCVNVKLNSQASKSNAKNNCIKELWTKNIV